MGIKEQVLEFLEKDGNMTAEQIAGMLGVSIEEVDQIISRLEEDNTIVTYKAVVNWEKTQRQTVTAFIELKVSPQRGYGFDRIAERINNYPEVKSVLLMSGSYDLAVIIEEKTLQEVSQFVWEKLAVMESVVSTATHFVLKKYKEDGVSFVAPPVVERGKNII